MIQDLQDVRAGVSMRNGSHGAAQPSTSELTGAAPTRQRGPAEGVIDEAGWLAETNEDQSWGPSYAAGRSRRGWNVFRAPGGSLESRSCRTECVQEAARSGSE